MSLLQRNPKTRPANYWRDTSHNQIIRRFIDLKGDAVNEKFETLLGGGVIRERIVEDLTYDLDHSEEDNLWSILYLTGYLTMAPEEEEPSDGCGDFHGSDFYGSDGGDSRGSRLDGDMDDSGDGWDKRTALRIPNEEIRMLFAETVVKWFQDSMAGTDRSGLFQAWWGGEEEQVTQEVSDILFRTISYFDYREDYYHAFVAGMFSGAGYEVSSNSERGMGRADVVVKDRRNRRTMVIEIKRSRTEGEMEQDCREAIRQIRDRQYSRQLQDKGYREILCYGAAFFKKRCLVRLAR